MNFHLNQNAISQICLKVSCEQYSLTRALSASSSKEQTNNTENIKKKKSKEKE